MSSSGTEKDGAGQAAPRPESLRDSLLLLPSRALFVAVAVVQLGVELAAKALRDALASRDSDRAS